MTTLEFFLVLVILALIAFFLYYFFRGTGGRVVISRPMESRVDIYIDRRFDLLMEEYSLVTRPKWRDFKAKIEPELAKQESKAETLKKFSDDLTETLAEMEKRLDVLEAESKTD